jgi:hypothetical protein
MKSNASPHSTEHVVGGDAAVQVQKLLQPLLACMPEAFHPGEGVRSRNHRIIRPTMSSNWCCFEQLVLLAALDARIGQVDKVRREVRHRRMRGGWVGVRRHERACGRRSRKHCGVINLLHRRF